MEIKQNTKIDLGELLLETAKNAKHLTPEMQKLIARYMDYQSYPAIVMSGKFNPNDIKRRVKL
jgi:hypothetical protein